MKLYQCLHNPSLECFHQFDTYRLLCAHSPLTELGVSYSTHILWVHSLHLPPTTLP
uniref:Uncharacterized protein n=1 Tax=Medicago truncatula TaxID=3880 RepID=A2Q3W1_MEDTR|nr:hypothetical protein MtrDRAFT_AC155890g6v2 [Medicago truncatula]